MAPFNQIDPETGGVLLVDKPLTWTSFDVVKKIKTNLRLKKVGHAGTLDPLATGLLIVCTGRQTKSIEQYQAAEKTYTGTILLGQTTPSLDMETEVEEEESIEHLTNNEILNNTTPFLGEIEQIPPQFSAIKVNGERTYKAARAGKDVIMKPRTVHIKAFEITSIEKPYIYFRVVCSKGTYIRSLARDFGKTLDLPACLYALKRTQIGNIDVKDALPPVEMVEKIKAQLAS